MFAVGVRRPSGRVHGLLDVAVSLVAVPLSPAACHVLHLSAVSLSGLSVAPTPNRVLHVLNRTHPTPPLSLTFSVLLAGDGPRAKLRGFGAARGSSTGQQGARKKKMGWSCSRQRGDR
jgi:hypothetical protein